MEPRERPSGTVLGRWQDCIRRNACQIVGTNVIGPEPTKEMSGDSAGTVADFRRSECLSHGALNPVTTTARLGKVS